MEEYEYLNSIFKVWWILGDYVLSRVCLDCLEKKMFFKNDFYLNYFNKNYLKDVFETQFWKLSNISIFSWMKVHANYNILQLTLAVYI